MVQSSAGLVNTDLCRRINNTVHNRRNIYNFTEQFIPHSLDEAFFFFVLAFLFGCVYGLSDLSLYRSLISSSDCLVAQIL